MRFSRFIAAIIGVAAVVLTVVVAQDVGRSSAAGAVQITAVTEPTGRPEAAEADQGDGRLEVYPGDVGPELALGDLSELPDQGVAVHIDTIDGPAVLLLDLDGTALGHVPGGSLANVGPEHDPAFDSAGPLHVVGAAGSIAARLPAGRLLDVPADGRYLELADGAALRWEQGPSDPWPYEYTGVTPPDGFVINDMAPRGATHDRGTIWSGGWNAPAEAWDTVTGAVSVWPPGCLPAHRVAEGMVVTCSRLDGEHDEGRTEAEVRAWQTELFEDRDWASVDVLQADGTRRLLVDLPQSAFRDGSSPYPSGRYRDAAVSPDGRWVAAQHSGECESPAAVYAEVGVDTRPRSLLNDELDGWIESTFHGWTSDNRALVYGTFGYCGTGAEGGPGLFLVDPASGTTTRLTAWLENLDRALIWRELDPVG